MFRLSPIRHAEDSHQPALVSPPRPRRSGSRSPTGDGAAAAPSYVVDARNQQYDYSAAPETSGRVRHHVSSSSQEFASWLLQEPSFPASTTYAHHRYGAEPARATRASEHAEAELLHTERRRSRSRKSSRSHRASSATGRHQPSSRAEADAAVITHRIAASMGPGFDADHHARAGLGGDAASRGISHLAVVFSKRLRSAVANDSALAVLASDGATQPFCMPRIQELVADLAVPANLEAILAATPAPSSSQSATPGGVVASPPRQPSPPHTEECGALRERVASLDRALDAARSDLASTQDRLCQLERELSVRDRQNDGLRSDLARVSALLEAEQHTGATPQRTQADARSSSTCSTAVGDDEPAPECQECASLRAAAAVADQRLTTLLSWVRKQQQLGCLGSAGAAGAPRSSSAPSQASVKDAASGSSAQQQVALFTEQIARLQAEEAAHRFKLYAECGLVCATTTAPFSSQRGSTAACPVPLAAAIQLARGALMTSTAHSAWQAQAHEYESHHHHHHNHHHAILGESPKRPPGLPRSAGDQGSAVVRRLWEEVEAELAADPAATL